MSASTPQRQNQNTTGLQQAALRARLLRESGWTPLSLLGSIASAQDTLPTFQIEGYFLTGHVEPDGSPPNHAYWEPWTTFLSNDTNQHPTDPGSTDGPL